MIIGLWCAHPDYTLRPTTQLGKQCMCLILKLHCLISHQRCQYPHTFILHLWHLHLQAQHLLVLMLLDLPKLSLQVAVTLTLHNPTHLQHFCIHIKLICNVYLNMQPILVLEDKKLLCLYRIRNINFLPSQTKYHCI